MPGVVRDLLAGDWENVPASILRASRRELQYSLGLETCVLRIEEDIDPDQLLRVTDRKQPAIIAPRWGLFATETASGSCGENSCCTTSDLYAVATIGSKTIRKARRSEDVNFLQSVSATSSLLLSSLWW